MPDFVPLEAQRVALLHEIAHAVADRRFDSRQFLNPPPPSPLEGDATRARLALVEGDATLTAMEVLDPTGAFLRPTALSGLAERLRGAAGEGRPPWLAELSRFIHVDGFLFAAQVRARQPWSAVDALWRDPPASSEQVLHREKYESCEAPIAVPESALPAVPGFDRPKASDVLGEMVIRAWLARRWTRSAPRARPRAGAAIAPGSTRPPRRPRSADGGAPVVTQPPLVWLTIGTTPARPTTSRAPLKPSRAPPPSSAATTRWRCFSAPPDLAPRALADALDAWKTLRQACARCSPTARSSARLSTS